MSISDSISWRCEEGQLFPLQPVFGSTEPKRAIYVSEELMDALMGPWDNPTDEYRLGELYGTLNQFIRGGRISIAMDPYDKDKSAYLAPLDPLRDRQWHIRSLAPKPAIRVFGHFAMTNVFVALTWRYRNELGGPDCPAWRNEINRCKTAWRQRLHPYQPFEGTEPHDYVSENIYVV